MSDNQEEKDLEFENDMFLDTFEKEEEEADKDWLASVDPEFAKNQEEEQQEEKEESDDDKNEEEEDDDDDKLNFEDNKEDEKDQIDLEKFNKEFGKDFKNKQELNDYLKGKDEKEELENDDAKLEQAQNEIAFLESKIRILPNGSLDSEYLMRSQFEMKAINDGKDLNDLEVKADIEEEIQKLIDNETIDLHAENLKNKLDKIIDQKKEVVKGIEDKREAAKLEIATKRKEHIQKQLSNFYALDNFYGVNLNKEVVGKAYTNANSGKLLEELNSNPELLAEFALFAEVKNEVFKKATGRTHSDGIKSVLDEFLENKDSKSKVSAAQERGSKGKKNVQEDLIAAVLYEAPKEKQE